MAIFLTSCEKEADLIARGEAQMSAGKHADAEIQFRKAIQKNPNSALAQRKLGQALAGQAKPREALAALLRAKELEPNDPNVQADLASQLLSMFLGAPQRPQVVYDQLRQLSRQIASREPKAFDSLRIDGVLAVADQRYSEGVDLLRQALAKSPGHEETTTALIEALFLDKKPKEAADLANSFLASHPKANGVYARLYRIYLNDGQPAEAFRVLERETQQFPNSSASIVRMAKHHISWDKDQAKAIELLNRIASDPKRYPEGKLSAASLMIEGKQYPMAIELLKKGIAENDPFSLELHKLLIECYRMAKDYPKSRQAIEEALAKYPKDESLRMAKAITGLEEGGKNSVEDALKNLDELKRSGMTDPRVDFQRARALFLLGRSKEGLDALQETVRRQRSNLDARYALAAYYLDSNKVQEAMRELDQIDSFAPGALRTAIYRVRALRFSRRFDEGLNYSRQALNAYPEDDELTFEQGMTYLDARRFKDATDVFSAMYNRGRKGISVLAALSQAYAGQKQFAPARAILDKEISANPQNPDLQALRATLLGQEGNLPAAIAAFEKLNLPDRPEPAILFSLAGLYTQAGDHEKSLAIHRQLTARRPDSPEAYNAWIAAAVASGKSDLVREPCQKWNERGKPDWAVLNNCAYGLARNGGDLAQAETWANQAARLQPQQANVKDTLGYVYIKQGKFQQAAAIYDSLQQQGLRSPSFLFHSGLAQAGNGQKQKARLDFEQALRARPAPAVEQEIKKALAAL